MIIGYFTDDDGKLLIFCRKCSYKKYNYNNYIFVNENAICTGQTDGYSDLFCDDCNVDVLNSSDIFNLHERTKNYSWR